MLGDAWLFRWFRACRWNGRSGPGSDCRSGSIPVDDCRGNRQQEDLTMTRSRCPRKPSVEQIVQLVVGVVNALARLLDAIHHWH